MYHFVTIIIQEQQQQTDSFISKMFLEDLRSIFLSWAIKKKFSFFFFCWTFMIMIYEHIFIFLVGAEVLSAKICMELLFLFFFK